MFIISQQFYFFLKKKYLLEDKKQKDIIFLFFTKTSLKRYFGDKTVQSSKYVIFPLSVLFLLKTEPYIKIISSCKK